MDGGALQPVADAGNLPSTDLVDGVSRIIDRGTPENTKRAYASDMRYVRAWAEARGVEAALPLSTETVVRFILDHVEGMPQEVESALLRTGAKRNPGPVSINTLKRRLATLSRAHELGDFLNPITDRRVREITSRAGKAAALDGWTPAKKTAAHREILDLILATCERGGARDIRDEAMILFGWSSGGRRRSEVSSATFERLERRGDDFVYHIGVNKTSQDGDAGTVPVAGRAAVAMTRWLNLSGINEGAIFRRIWYDGSVGDDGLCDRTVARIIQARAARAGLDAHRYGGHSLRSGFITEAGIQGVNLLDAMAMSLHRSVQVASGYHQAGAALNNQGARLAG